MPIIAQYVSQTRLIPMQDNALGHAARATLAFIREKGLVLIFKLANSPDLNPIKTL